MTLKKTFSTLLLAAILCASFGLSAQVTIGSGRAPSQWSLLYLDASEQRKALHNARMDSEQRDSLVMPDSPVNHRDSARGLMIFNIENDCLEFWSGTRWVSLCVGDEVCEPFTSVTYSPAPRVVERFYGHSAVELSVTPVGGTEPYIFRWFRANDDGSSTLLVEGATTNYFETPNNLPEGTHTFYVVITKDCAGVNNIIFDFTVDVVDPARIPRSFAHGILSGRACFDIGVTTCEQLTPAVRASRRADFTNRNINIDASIFHGIPSTGVHNYVFSPSIASSISNIRYVIVDPDSVIDRDNTPLVRTLLEGDWLPHHTNHVFFPVYFREDLNSDPEIIGRSRAESAIVTIHIIFFDNILEIDQRVSLDVRIRDCMCCGAFVGQNDWREFMCHNLGVNATLNPFAPAHELYGNMYKWGTGQVALSAADNMALTFWGGGTPTVSDWANRGGTPPTGTADWVMTPRGWNPCPAGWRVPTASEWEGVADIRLNFQRGVSARTHDFYFIHAHGNFFGFDLFLPVVNYIDQFGRLRDRHHQQHRFGMYWSSSSDSFAGNNLGANFQFISGVVGGFGIGARNRQSGMPIRCIAE